VAGADVCSIIAFSPSKLEVKYRDLIYFIVVMDDDKRDGISCAAAFYCYYNNSNRKRFKGDFCNSDAGIAVFHYQQFLLCIMLL